MMGGLTDESNWQRLEGGNERGLLGVRRELGRPDDAGIAAQVPTQPEGARQTCGCTSEHARKPLEGAKYKCDGHF